jgi:hypothetical protein
VEAESVHAHEEQQARTPATRNRAAGTSAATSQSAYSAARTPETAAAATALQHSVGNQAYVVARRMAPPEAHTHGAGCGHGGMHSQTGELADPQEQTEALAAAQATAGMKLSGPKLTDAQSYFQNPAMSQVSIHTGPAVQRALAAFQASSMTVGTEIFLGRSQDERHEWSHANEYLKGIRATGKDAGAGIPVTEKDQDSERSAELDASAQNAGAKIAPSELRRMPAAQRAALEQEQ